MMPPRRLRWVKLGGDGRGGEERRGDEPENEVKSRLFLDVVVAQGSSVFELFTCEDQALLIWWNSIIRFVSFRFREME